MGAFLVSYIYIDKTAGPLPFFIPASTVHVGFKMII